MKIVIAKLVKADNPFYVVKEESNIFKVQHIIIRYILIVFIIPETIVVKWQKKRAASWTHGMILE